MSLIACYALVVQLAATTLLAWLGPQWLWRATLVVESGFLAALLIYVCRFDLQSLGLRRVDWADGIKIVIWFQAIAFASDAVILWLTPAPLVDEYLQLFRPATSSEWLALAGVAAGAAPVIEELLFRGFLLAALRHRIGILTAIFGTTVLFALIHLKPVQILAALPLGLMLAAYVARGGSLYVTAAAHILGNGFSFLGLAYAGIPWISADWHPNAAEGMGSLVLAVFLLWRFLQRYPIIQKSN
ncbi:MAG: CPBP family intramembrane glutamic endopeptidase [Methylohalobius sp. ZOD2]